MDKEEMTRAAREAIRDLQLDCEITEVTRPIGKDIWCIQFTGSFGQFCDSFHDKAGKENSARVVREKIKRFFLKQRKPTRIVRGRGPAMRDGRSRRSGESNLLGTLLEVGEGAIKQAARIGGEVIERAANVNRTVLETEADWIQTISPTAAEMIRPGSAGTTRTEALTPPQRTVDPPAAQTGGQQKPSRAFKSTQKASRRSTGKKKTGAKKTRATKKSDTTAAKKRSPKTAKKSATSKRGTKASKKKKSATKTTGKKGASRKKSGSKKKSSSKSQRGVKLFF
jgi:hypothetical protein